MNLWQRARRWWRGHTCDAFYKTSTGRSYCIRRDGHWGRHESWSGQRFR